MSQKGRHSKVKEPAALEAGKYCPFVDSPSDDCYVVRIDSLSAEKAIHYCGWKFEECKIYQRRINREPP
jgi:hypothetical protein